MIKIKFLKDFETCKVGDIKSASKKSAEDFVNNGYAEYVEEPKPKKKEVPDNNFRVEQFEKFYSLLMANAPEWYKPWFFPCEKLGKDPSSEAILKIDKTSKGSWHHESARLTKEQAVEHILNGYNIGISARVNDCLLIGDIDNPEYLSQMPKETLTSTSRKRVGGHFFGLNKDNSAKINLTTDNGEIRSSNQYVLCVGSYVPFNLKNKKEREKFDSLPESAKNDKYLGYYTLRDELPLRELTFEDFPQFFKDYHKKESEQQKILLESEESKKEYKKIEGEWKYSELLNLKMSDIVGKLPPEARVGHPLHESDTDANFSLSEDGTLANCWRHLVSLNPVQFLCVKAGYSNCRDAGTPHKIQDGQGNKISQGVSKLKGDKRALEVAYQEALKLGVIKEWKESEGKIIPLKSIDVVPNKVIRTRILISDISPGINLLKGYHVTCPKCEYEKIIYSKPKDDSCCEVFKKEKTKEAKEENEEGFEVCMDYNYQIGKSVKTKVNIESLNDTGYLCGAFDPNDSGTAPQFSSVFFSNNIIPKDILLKEKFETDIQIKPLVITAKIITLPTSKKVTEWVLDVIDFQFEEKKIQINFDLLHKFKDIPRDNSFFEKNFVPSIFGRHLTKKVYALNLLSPLKAKLENNAEVWCVPRVMDAGDPGQSKTLLFSKSLDYCRDLIIAKLISVENSTNRGLIGASVKNPTTNQWMIKTGQVTLCNRGFVGLDGYGKLNQNDFAELRGIMEEHSFQINKAGHTKRECILRLVALANLRNPVENYPTKHKSSYDISATTEDRTGKFSGADRRRFWHVLISGDRDTSAKDIDRHLFLNYNPLNEEELSLYWNNLRAFAWSLNPEDFVWEEGTINLALEGCEILRRDYNNFLLDYGILSKGGTKQFLGQLPAVAILHESITPEGKVEIKKSHAKWLFDLYQQEFTELGLDQENEYRKFYEICSELILQKINPGALEVLDLIHQHGSQTAVEKKGIISRMSMWRRFKEIIEIELELYEKEEKKKIYYSLGDGSVLITRWDNWGKPTEFEPDGTLPPVSKSDGTITEFGRYLINKARKFRKDFKVLSKGDSKLKDSMLEDLE